METSDLARLKQLEVDNTPKDRIVARLVLAEWRNEFNTKRPHKALGWQTPEEFSRSFSTTQNYESLHLSSVA